MKTITNITYPAFALFAFACFALAPQAQATCEQGCLTNDSTVLGDDALSTNTGFNNTAIGFQALLNNTTGYENTAVGVAALASNTIGTDNVALGQVALGKNTTGRFNTAIGVGALYNNTTGGVNTAIGNGALGFATTGEANTAIGALAMYSDYVTGDNNTAIGASALARINTGSNNTATGLQALEFNTAGSENTATGSNALVNNTTGNDNTATGSNALANDTTGSENTATGINALTNNTIGNDNAATGINALVNNTTGNNNTAMGINALVNNRKGSSNIALGSSAGSALTTGDNNIDIGNAGVAREADHIRIGTAETHKHTFIAGISGSTVAGGVAVIIDTDGHLGTTVSSARFKQDIKPMDKASEAILALNPVTFRYKKELDPKGIPQFGLVAEEVEKVNPDLVARDEQGKPYTVRYEALNAMLLNEFLKEHKAFVEEQCNVQEQGATIARLEKEVEMLTAGLQKVSAQLELSKSAPQTALNDH